MHSTIITPPEGYEIDEDKSSFREIFYKKKETTLPESWEEAIDNYKGEYISSDYNIINTDAESDDTYRNILPKGLAAPMLALCQLLVLRDIYRQGWVPDWSDSSDKYVIMFYSHYVDIACNNYISRLLSFQSTEIRNLFLKNFKDLIEKAKELI